jgi:crossover junction endodeoxyribonuclease RuvC
MLRCRQLQEASMIVGIDPGIDGAIAVLVHHGDVRIYDMPSCTKDRGKGRQVDALALARLFMVLPEEPDMVVCEKVASTPQMGVTSAFSFGRSVGVVEGILAARMWPVMYVRPQQDGSGPDVPRAI